MFKKVLQLRKNEPQSYRDLGLLLIKRAKYQQALNLLWKVVIGKWDERFDEIELTVLFEINRLLYLAKTHKITLTLPDQLRFNKRLLSSVEVDLRISMAWDTDNTDIDLHVIEPTGEECYYQRKQTTHGGMLSRDFTRGYGPEEYILKTGIAGVFKIRAKYFASHKQSLSGGTTILLSIFTKYSTSEEESKLITLRLQSSQDLIDVADVEWKATDAEKQEVLKKVEELEKKIKEKEKEIVDLDEKLRKLEDESQQVVALKKKEIEQKKEEYILMTNK